MNTTKVAEAVKDYLVKLAVKDKLPMDLNDLSVSAIEKVIKKALPSDREKMITKAGDYLCDSELTIEEMVDAIMAHENGNDMIDNVDGVVVWEKVENSFNCNEFIEMIS